MLDTAKKSPSADLYTAAYNWALSFGPKLIIGIIVFVIGLWVISFVKKRIRSRMTKKQIHSSLQPFLLSLSITTLYILLVIVVMEIMGIGLTIFTAVIGAGGIAAGLALSGTLQNFAGGVLILLLKPFSIDDNIIAQGFDGFVTSIQVFYTVVLTHDNKTIIIPNGKLFNETIVNVTMEGKRRLDLEMKFNYGVDKDKVISIIEKAITQSADVLTDPAHKVGIIALEPDGFKLSIRVWIPTIKFTAVKFDLHDKVLKDIIASGIKLPGMA